MSRPCAIETSAPIDALRLAPFDRADVSDGQLGGLG
jgi:hypothetical protein